MTVFMWRNGWPYFGVNYAVRFPGSWGFIFVLVMILLTGDTEAQNRILYVLDAVYTTDTYLEETVKAYRAGLEASFWSHQYTVAGDIKLEVIPIDKKSDYTTISSSIDKAMKNCSDILAVLGPVGEEALKHALPALEQHDLVALAPLSGSSHVRYWNPHFYFLNKDVMAALFAVMNYAVSVLRVKRVAFMHLTGVLYGEKEYEIAKKIMSDIGHKLCGSFVLDGKKVWKDGDPEFEREWEQFVATRPQAVLMFGNPSTGSSTFAKKILTDNRTKDVYLLAALNTQSTLISTWMEAVKEGYKFNDGQLIITGANPLPTDTRYVAIREFRSVMKRYLNHSKKYYTDTEHFLKDETAGETMVSGWLVGEIIIQMFASREWLSNRTVFSRSIFNQRRYIVHDLVIGDFGGECNARTEAQGAVCRCNQGGRTVLFKKLFQNSSLIAVLDAEFTYPLGTCYSISHALYPPLNAVMLQVEYDPTSFQIAYEVEMGAQAGLPPKRLQKHLVGLKTITSSLENAAVALLYEEENFLTDLVFGSVTPSMLSVPNLLFIDPIFPFPTLTPVMENVLFFSPTLEQQLFVISNYLGSIRDSLTSVNAVIRGPSSSEVAEVLRKSLETFDVTLGSKILLKAEDLITGRMPEEGEVFLLGIIWEDIAELTVHMQKHKKLRVYMLFFDFSTIYDPLIREITDKYVMERIIFATSLPHWGEKNSTSPTVLSFQKNSNLLPWVSPLIFCAFAHSRAIKEVTDSLRNINSKLIQKAFFSRITIASNDMIYGPYFSSEDSDCVKGENVGKNPCLLNYGANSLSLWSMHRAQDPSVPALTNPMTFSIEYGKPTKDSSVTDKIIEIITRYVLPALVLIGFICALVYILWGRNACRYAPKKPGVPVTLIFTDVQSSTALWAACPEIMPEAVATHHRLIRHLIAKYKCYEVKTVGDSFMIACKCPHAAVQLVGDLQRTFLHHDWGTNAIDKAYHEFEKAQAEEDADYKPPTARLDDAVYREHWNGMRVRAGVHTGLSDIRFDEVTKRYDYYGSTSNTAARTESVANGGQVLLTRAAYMALSSAERAELNVTALGAVELRGVPEPVEMFQLNPVPGRAFAELRLDREFNNFEDDTEASVVSEIELPDCSKEVFRRVLEMFLGALPTQQRVQIVEPFCRCWNVQVRSAANILSRNDAFHDTVKKLAEAMHIMKEKKLHDRHPLRFDRDLTLSLLSSHLDSSIALSPPRSFLFELSRTSDSRGSRT